VCVIRVRHERESGSLKEKQIEQPKFKSLEPKTISERHRPRWSRISFGLATRRFRRRTTAGDDADQNPSDSQHLQEPGVGG
jgi:hypothetical protein